MTEIRWTSIVKVIGKHLVHFCCDYSFLASDLRCFPTIDDLSLLGTSLETLYLDLNGAEHAFWAKSSSPVEIPPSTSPTPLDIAKVWPNLKTLDLLQDRTYDDDGIKLCLATIDSAILTLPQTLTYLAIRNEVAPEYIEALPIRLTTLKVSYTSIQTSSLKFLPRTLERLSCSSIRLVMEQMPGIGHISWTKTYGDLESLPQELKKLVCGIVSPIPYAPPELVKHLPRSLTKLRFGSYPNSECWQYLEQYLPNLTTLKLSSRKDLWSPASHFLHRIPNLLDPATRELWSWDKRMGAFIRCGQKKRGGDDKFFRRPPKTR
jgi:hypothetical protein